MEEVTVCCQSAIDKVITTRKNKENSKYICELKKCVLCMPVFQASISEGVDHEPASMDILSLSVEAQPLLHSSDYIQKIHTRILTNITFLIRIHIRNE